MMGVRCAKALGHLHISGADLCSYEALECAASALKRPGVMQATSMQATSAAPFPAKAMTMCQVISESEEDRLCACPNAPLQASPLPQCKLQPAHV